MKKWKKKWTQRIGIHQNVINNSLAKKINKLNSNSDG